MAETSSGASFFSVAFEDLLSLLVGLGLATAGLAVFESGSPLASPSEQINEPVKDQGAAEIPCTKGHDRRTVGFHVDDSGWVTQKLDI